MTIFRLLRLILLLLYVSLFSFQNHAQHKKFRSIQRIIDKATSKQLAGVSVFIKSPKLGTWIGTSGFSNLENKEMLVKDDIFSLASIGKTYTATAILKLAEEGVLNIDDNISNYQPAEIIDNAPNGDKVTIRQLLAHTSGFANYNTDPELNRLYLKGMISSGSVL